MLIPSYLSSLEGASDADTEPFLRSGLLYKYCSLISFCLRLNKCWHAGFEFSNWGNQLSTVNGIVKQKKYSTFVLRLQFDLCVKQSLIGPKSTSHTKVFSPKNWSFTRNTKHFLKFLKFRHNTLNIFPKFAEFRSVYFHTIYKVVQWS